MTKQTGEQINTNGFYWATIVAATEKAIRLSAQGTGAVAWFPRKAFVAGPASKFDGQPISWGLARWFRPTRQQERALGWIE
jgi:hypothetical protein